MARVRVVVAWALDDHLILIDEIRPSVPACFPEIRNALMLDFQIDFARIAAAKVISDVQQRVTAATRSRNHHLATL